MAGIGGRIKSIAAVTAVIVVGTLAILIATGGSAGGGSQQAGAGSPSGGRSSGSGGSPTVDIANFKYEPAELTVPAGSTVTFTNQDSAAHTATSDDSGVFDTGTLGQGDSAPVTLNKPGTYTYFCEFHAFMHGTITVK